MSHMALCDLFFFLQKHMPYIRLMFNIGYGISLVSLVLATSLMVSFRYLIFLLPTLFCILKYINTLNTVIM